MFNSEHVMCGGGSFIKIALRYVVVVVAAAAAVVDCVRGCGSG